MLTGQSHLKIADFYNLSSYIYLTYLTYCIEVWGCASKSHLQKKIVRIMTFSSYLEHSAPLFMSLKLLPIEKVFISRVAIVMFKIPCDMLPETMAKLYSKNKDYHAHDTRGKNLLHIPAGTKDSSINSARIWNAICSKIDVKVSLVKFKLNLKKYLLHNTLEFTYTK